MVIEDSISLWVVASFQHCTVMKNSGPMYYRVLRPEGAVLGSRIHWSAAIVYVLGNYAYCMYRVNQNRKQFAVDYVSSLTHVSR